MLKTPEFKVICINDDGIYLELYKVYDAVKYNDDRYIYIYQDEYSLAIYHKKRFKTLKDFRKERLNKLIKYEQVLGHLY